MFYQVTKAGNIIQNVPFIYILAEVSPTSCILTCHRALTGVNVPLKKAPGSETKRRVRPSLVNRPSAGGEID